jgi:hypothetical protein
MLEPAAIQNQVPLGLEIAARVSQIATGILTLVVLYISVLASVRSKRSDILMECHRSYNDVVSRRHAADVKPTWHLEFWSRQHHQFDHWRAGDVETATFKFWTFARMNEWHGDAKVADVAIRAGWELYREKAQADAPFVRFIEMAVGAKQVDDALRTFGPRGFRHHLRRIMGLTA